MTPAPVGWPRIHPAPRSRAARRGDRISGVLRTRAACRDGLKSAKHRRAARRWITLRDLFVHEQDGLDRLSEQTRQIWPSGYGDGEPMADEPDSRPIAENFANWFRTAEGQELHLADYQFLHGMPVITVLRASLTELLTPAMAALALH